MRRMFRMWLAALVVLVAPAAWAQEALKPVILAVFPSYDELMADVDYLGGLSGQPQASQQIEQILALFTQGQGLAGLDKTKPCGAAMFLDGGQPVGAAFVPVTDVKKLLASLEGFVGVAEESQDHHGLLELSVQGQTLYVKQQNGWAWFSNSPDLLAKVPKTPQEWIGPLAKLYDFAVQVRLQNIPEFYRQLAIELIRQGAEEGRAEIDDPELQKMQKKALQIQLKQVEEIISSLDQITLGCRVDRKNRNVGVGVQLTALPDSVLGRVMAGYSPLPARFTAFAPQGAIFRINMAAGIGDAVRDYYRGQWGEIEELLTMVGDLRKKIPPDSKDAEKMQGVISFLKGYMQFLNEVLEADGYELAFSVENQQGHLFLSGVGYAPGGPNFVEFVTRGLDTLTEVAGEHLKIQRDVARQGDVRFHRISAELDEEERAEVEQLFGTGAALVLAVSPNGVFAAYGAQALEKLQKRLAAAKASPPKKLPYFGYGEFALRPLLDLLKKQVPHEEVVPVMLEALPQGNQDKVRLKNQLLRNGQRIELVIDEGVLRAILAAVRASQEAQAVPEF